MGQYRDIGGLYWLAMAVLLAFGMSGWAAALSWAIGLGAMQLPHFGLRKKHVAAFPVRENILAREHSAGPAGG